MAAHCLSNLSISRPTSTQTVVPLFAHKPNSPKLSNPLKVKAAMAERSKDNLDHLQRTNMQKTQQPRRSTSAPYPIGSWDRFPTARTVQQMMETMERIMEDPFSYTTQQWAPPVPPADSVGFGRGRTPWEIKEGESEYKMRFDMPGMTKQDVKVCVEDKMLVVRAEKAKEENDEEENGTDSEEWSAKSYGKYSCRIALPENVQFEKIKAEVKDGVLYVTVPKVSGGAKVLDINVE